MPLSFTAVDFETANSHSASACSVGLVKVVDGRVVDRVGWLIRPPAGAEVFSPWNVRVHGIEAVDVEDAPSWEEQYDDLVEYVDGDPLVAHNARFDAGVIRAACELTALECPDVAVLCSLAVARRTYHLDSYRLPVVAMAAGFEDFPHHDALADAEACARITVHAAARHGVDSLDALAAVTGTELSRLRPSVLERA